MNLSLIHICEFENVFHELVSPDIHVDICVVPPSKERDYYTLVTMGMGAHRMNVPEELAEYKLERAELAIALPPDWKMDEESMKEMCIRDRDWITPCICTTLKARKIRASHTTWSRSTSLACLSPTTLINGSW